LITFCLVAFRDWPKWPSDSSSAFGPLNWYDRSVEGQKVKPSVQAYFSKYQITISKIGGTHIIHHSDLSFFQTLLAETEKHDSL